MGVKRITRRGPGLMLEFRNHHISNAGTRGENLGVNAAMVVAGVIGCCVANRPDRPDLRLV